MTLNGKVFSYTYGYTSTINLSTGPASDVVLDVTLTFSYRNARLKVVCSGEGPLDGKVFIAGLLKTTKSKNCNAYHHDLSPLEGTLLHILVGLCTVAVFTS